MNDIVSQDDGTAPGIVIGIEEIRSKIERLRDMEQSLVTRLYKKTVHLKSVDVIRFIALGRLVTIQCNEVPPNPKAVRIKKEHELTL